MNETLQLALFWLASGAVATLLMWTGSRQIQRHVSSGSKKAYAPLERDIHKLDLRTELALATMAKMLPYSEVGVLDLELEERIRMLNEEKRAVAEMTKRLGHSQDRVRRTEENFQRLKTLHVGRLEFLAEVKQLCETERAGLRGKIVALKNLSETLSSMVGRGEFPADDSPHGPLHLFAQAREAFEFYRDNLEMALRRLEDINEDYSHLEKTYANLQLGILPEE